MSTANAKGLNPRENGPGEYTELRVSEIIRKIEKAEGAPLAEVRARYTEQGLFQRCLEIVTTTKKALCVATGIPVEAACRYKRQLEKEGLLKESELEVICAFTNHPAKLISTRPDEFPHLENSNQLKLELSI